MGYYLTGAQYNPVVTLVVFIRGGISLKTAVTYVVMQGIAGLCGGAIGSTILGGKLALVLADDAKVRCHSCLVA
jgi:glycerol uptake facilitator-like aquaporin